MENLGLDNLKAQFFVYANRPDEATQAYLEGGETLRAVDVLLSTGERGHQEQAKEIILQDMWKLQPMQAIGVDVDAISQVLVRASRVTEQGREDEVSTKAL